MYMTTKKCPCKGCICVPVCRHKTYGQLFRDCILLQEYEPIHRNYDDRDIDKIGLLQRVLKPSQWRFGFSLAHTPTKPLVYGIKDQNVIIKRYWR